VSDAPGTLAAIHAEAFPPADAWGEGALRRLLEMPGAMLLAEDDGFLLARIAEDEAEIITLAVRPAARRRGLGARLLARALRACADAGAAVMFLEVDTANAPALALYARAGFARVGTRRGYYGPGRDAAVLRLSLS